MKDRILKIMFLSAILGLFNVTSVFASQEETDCSGIVNAEAITKGSSDNSIKDKKEVTEAVTAAGG